MKAVGWDGRVPEEGSVVRKTAFRFTTMSIEPRPIEHRTSPSELNDLGPLSSWPKPQGTPMEKRKGCRPTECQMRRPLYGAPYHFRMCKTLYSKAEFVLFLAMGAQRIFSRNAKFHASRCLRGRGTIKPPADGRDHTLKQSS
jgi:hypothetical protein